MPDELNGQVAYDSSGSSFNIPAPVAGGGNSPYPFIAAGAATRLGAAMNQSAAISAQGAYQANQERTNAHLAKISADTALTQGAWQANQIRKSGEQRSARTIASSGAQGVTAGSMAPMAGAERTAAGIDALQAKANAYKTAFGFETEALQHSTAAEFTTQAANASSRNTLLTGGLQAIQGGLKDYVDYDRAANYGR